MKNNYRLVTFFIIQLKNIFIIIFNILKCHNFLNLKIVKINISYIF